MSYQNEYASITHHRNSKRGKIVDYVISFYESKQDIEKIVVQAADIFRQLIEEYFKRGKSVKARLVAKAQYKHINMELNGQESDRVYYFPSYHSEVIEDIDEFFTSHLLKIASRMDSFHTNGSNLVLDYIEHIHVEINVLN